MPTPTPLRSPIYPRFESLDATAEGTPSDPPSDTDVTTLGKAKVVLVPPREWVTHSDAPLGRANGQSAPPDQHYNYLPLAYIQPSEAKIVNLNHFRGGDPVAPGAEPPPPPAPGDEAENVLLDMHFDWKRNWEHINKKEYKLYASFTKKVSRQLIVRMNAPIGTRDTSDGAAGTTVTEVPPTGVLYSSSVGVDSGAYTYDVPGEGRKTLYFDFDSIQPTIDAYIAGLPAGSPSRSVTIDNFRPLKLLGVLAPNFKSRADKYLVGKNETDPPIIYYGVVSPPAFGLGKEGDYYVDTLAYPKRYWGPKLSAIDWGATSNTEFAQSVYDEAKKYRSNKEQIISALYLSTYDRLFLFDEPDYFTYWVYPQASVGLPPPLTLLWDGYPTSNKTTRAEDERNEDDFRPGGNLNNKSYIPRLAIGRFIRDDPKFPIPGVAERFNVTADFNPYQPGDSVIPYDTFAEGKFAVDAPEGPFRLTQVHPPLYNGGYNPWDGIGVRAYDWKTGFATVPLPPAPPYAGPPLVPGSTHLSTLHYGDFHYDYDPEDKWFGGDPDNATTASWSDGVGGSFTADIAYVTFGWTYELALVEELPAS